MKINYNIFSSSHFDDNAVDSWQFNESALPIWFKSSKILAVIAQDNIVFCPQGAILPLHLSHQIAKHHLTNDNDTFLMFASDETEHFALIEGCYSNSNVTTQVFIPYQHVLKLLLYNINIGASSVKNMFFRKEITVQRMFLCCLGPINYHDYWNHNCTLLYRCAYCNKTISCVKYHLLNQCSISNIPCPLCLTCCTFQSVDAHFQNEHDLPIEIFQEDELICGCVQCVL